MTWQGVWRTLAIFMPGIAALLMLMILHDLYAPAAYIVAGLTIGACLFWIVLTNSRYP